MANILIVDDDRNFLLSFVEGLKAHDGNFHILTADNGRQAIRVLRSEPVDLVVTDLKMPVMDGFELLADMSRHFPRIPVIVITAFGTPEIEKNIRSRGGFQYLEKPLDFTLTLERIYEGLEAKSGGFIRGISLPSFLQLMEIEKKTCMLNVHAAGRNGTLYFNQGDLIDAETESGSGEMAAYDIIAWDEAEIEIVSKLKRREKRIDSSLHFVVLESCRRKDERIHAQNGGGGDPGTEPEEIVFSYEEPGPVQLEPAGEERCSSPGEPMELSAEEQIAEEAIKPNHKECSMNIKRLNEAMEELKTNVGPGLLSSSIVSSNDGQVIINFQGNPRACALFTQITNYLNRALKESGLPELGKYYIIDMTNNKQGIVIPLGEFWWGMVTDSQKAPLGLLLNIAIPRAIEVFEEAMVN